MLLRATRRWLSVSLAFSRIFHVEAIEVPIDDLCNIAFQALVNKPSTGSSFNGESYNEATMAQNLLRGLDRALAASNGMAIPEKSLRCAITSLPENNILTAPSHSSDNSEAEPCNFFGVLKAVAPWAPQGSNNYETPWHIDVPLDLRGIVASRLPQDNIRDQFETLCLSATENKVFGHRLQVRSCTDDLMKQVNYFVDVVCARDIGDKCVNPTPFDRICQLTGTDKSSFFHDFCAFYDAQLFRFSGKPKSLLEVGVLRGASAFAWSAKFPCTEIDTLDAFQNSTTVHSGRFSVSFADQEIPETLHAATSGKIYDIIVDDGGHTMKQQQNTLQALWGNVAPCGVFIMEDLHTSIQVLLGTDIGIQWGDHLPVTYDVLFNRAESSLLNMSHIESQASAIMLFRPHDDHITAAIHKKC